MMKQKLKLLGFDAEDALDRFFGDSCLLEKYIGLMVVDFNQRLPETKTAIDRRDFKEAAQQLHSLQGSAFALAALDLAGACKFCEEMCLMSDERNAIESLKSIELQVSKISQSVVNPLP